MWLCMISVRVICKWGHTYIIINRQCIHFTLPATSHKIGTCCNVQLKAVLMWSLNGLNVAKWLTERLMSSCCQWASACKIIHSFNLSDSSLIFFFAKSVLLFVVSLNVCLFTSVHFFYHIHFMYCVWTNIIVLQRRSCSNRYRSVELIRLSASTSANMLCLVLTFVSRWSERQSWLSKAELVPSCDDLW